MKALIVGCSFGILAFSEKNELVEKVLFPKKPQIAAKALTGVEDGKIVDEVATIISLLRNSCYETFVFENTNLAKEVQKIFGVKIEVTKSSKVNEIIRSKMEKFALDFSFVKDAQEFSLWTRDVSIEITKLRVKAAIEKRDLLISQAIQTLDDLDKTINLFMSHIREWYGIHFPELDRLVEKHETYARLILNLGCRDNFVTEDLEKAEIPKSKSELIAGHAKTSMGAEITEMDLAQIQDLCKAVISLNKLRKRLESYLNKTMGTVAPNTKALAGALLGARLIAISGDLINLAKKPSSTIQVLGAEKALFRSLKTGTKPPKHGIIFQHPLLHEAKKWQRGKIARALAGKLAIAVRTDAFGNKYIGNRLKAALKKRIKEIREKYSEQPKAPERKKPTHKKKWRKKKRAGKS